MKTIRKWLCKWFGHDWAYGIMIHQCRRCGQVGVKNTMR